MNFIYTRLKTVLARISVQALFIIALCIDRSFTCKGKGADNERELKWKSKLLLSMLSVFVKSTVSLKQVVNNYNNLVL